MPTYGHISEFDPQEEDWTFYSERLNSFFAANTITSDQRKAAILLSSVGAKTYRLISNLTSPDLPSAKTFAQLCNIVSTHFTPRKSVMVSRFHFNQRRRHQGETIMCFVAALRDLAKDCKFENNLNTMLRDRLVVGVNDENVQKRLLSEPDDLTFERALELSLAIESASKQVQRIQGKAEVVDFVKKKESSTKKPAYQKPKQGQATSGKQCHSCGNTSHLRKDCKFRNVVCLKCHKKGHIAKVCGLKVPLSVKAHRVEPELVHTSEDEYNGVYSVDSSHHVTPCRMTLNVGGKNITFEVDTGSGATIINEETYMNLFQDCQLDTVDQLRLFAQHEIDGDLRGPNRRKSKADHKSQEKPSRGKCLVMGRKSVLHP